MASTYSTNLKIELIGTGEQDGTWGTTTNTNLGTLLEQAVSGYVTQAITDGSGANTTITIPDGTTGVARNMFIEMTGALTFSTTSLIVPANKKLYFIYNNTTGGFAVTVKVTGLTGVSVPNGRKVILVCNGTDIVEAHNAISGNATVGGTLVVTGTANAASLTLGAALPVASGGTGVTSSTGSGANVLSTSPTLVTPILGTPTSGTLTNCTGFPVANISGLGTGVATFLATPSSANLAAAVTGETGTGALVFGTSPTLVTPALGTPSALVGTNITGTAAGLTAGNVTTNANLTGGVTSVGNAATVVTNANLTGAVTSVGNATSLGSFTSAQLAGAVTNETGSGLLVFGTSPTLTTPVISSIVNTGTLTLPTSTDTLVGRATTDTLTNKTINLASNTLTATSAQIATAVTDETGSGALVFATSPTLVTPALGTPSSGTLTSCTDLPIVAGTTGTLSVARGGTGVTNSVGTGNYVMLNSSPTVDGTGIGYPDAATAGGFSDNQMAFGFLGSDAYVSIDNSTAGVFFTTSDYRIKKNVRTLLSNATYITNAIRVVDYEVLELDGTQRPEAVGVRRAGVIAHEIQELIPSAASGTKDAVNADGSPRYQSVNYDAVVPYLIKTIQELTARIEKLEG